MTSQFSKSSHSETRNCINYPCVAPLNAPYRRTSCLKNQLIRLRTLGEEAFGVTLPEVKIANNRFCCSSMGTSGSLKA